MKIYKREKLFEWFVLFKRALCILMRGHKFPTRTDYFGNVTPALGKRSDLICLRCGEIFYTKKNYKKGKHRK